MGKANIEETLTEHEKAIILKCLKASVGEEFFPDWEFHTLTGYRKDDVKTMIGQWPNIDLNEKGSRDLVLNIINNLLGYPHNSTKEQWNKFLSASPDELSTLWNKISSKEEKSGIDKYFDRLR